ncbi:hypothetical protein C8Q78DRAFT_1022603 [Trametes maxima]|nr:hypothetical protein C8Q78DRAFT_1022603 [Trametes maxima]
MEWWNLFRKVRKVAFAFIALASLAWAVVLSLYLSKEWAHFSTLQRAIVLALIGVNALTSLLLYLMIVVVFRMWKELLRMLFLLAIHIGTAVPFTLYRFSFPCDFFGTKTACKVVALTFLATAWSITGLLLGYTVYLCIMSRVPRPFPLITPNNLLSTPPVSRAPSMVSVSSATHLLAQPTSATLASASQRPASPASVYSQHSSHSRTVPKRLFLANSSGAPHDLSYGAIDTQSRVPAPSIVRSRFSTSTIGSIPASPPPPTRLHSLRASISEHLLHRRPSASPVPPVPQLPQERSVAKTPPRPLLLNASPFTDPLSRHGTPETALSGLSFTSAPANPNLGRMAPPMQGPYGHFLSPYVFPAGAPTGSPFFPGSQFGDRAGSPQTYPVMPHLLVGYPAPYMQYAGGPVGAHIRSHSATPSAASIHSMSPSIHFTHPFGNTLPHPAALTPSHPASGSPGLYPNFHDARGAMGGMLAPPPSAHLRSASDPVFRPYTADPSPRRPPGLYADGSDNDIALPNPYAAGAEIRRYGSVPHVRAAGASAHAAYGPAPRGPVFTAGWTGHGARVHEKGIVRGWAAAGDPRWREAVLKAAGAEEMV